jgi:hypothetical protein
MQALGPAGSVPAVSMKMRVIEYEILTWAESRRITVLKMPVKPVGPEIGVLRCVDPGGQKLTFNGSATVARRLVASGRASDPGGVELTKDKFPIVRDGWPGRIVKPVAS